MSRVRRVAALKAVWDAVRGVSRPGSPGVVKRLRAVPRMLSLGLSGRYPHLAKGRVALALISLVYLFSPVDAVPELLLPVIGFGDDAFVAAWLVGVLLSETDTFLDWADHLMHAVREVGADRDRVRRHLTAKSYDSEGELHYERLHPAQGLWIARVESGRWVWKRVNRPR